MKNRLLLHKDLYNRVAIQNAVKAFGSLASIEMKETKDYYDIFFDNCVTDEMRTLSEFENYVLIETIKAAGDLYA